MTKKNIFSSISIHIFKVILILSIMLILGNLSFAAMPYYTPPCYTAYIIPAAGNNAFILPDAGNNAFIHSKEEKEPTQEQLRAGKGVGSILWSKKTGGPRNIRGNLTAPSREDPKTIAWRFLKEKKVLYGIKNPNKDLRIKTFINGRYATTIHFQQMYKKIPVESYLVVSILPNGVIHAISGEYYSELDVDINPMVSAKKAGQISSRHGQKHDARVRELPEIPDSLAPGLLIRPSSQGKDCLLWHFTGRGGWEYYIDAHDETIRNAISPIRNNFQPATGWVLPTKDLPDGAVVSFHLNDEVNRLYECPGFPPVYDPEWPPIYEFEDDLSTGTTKVIVYNADSTSKTATHCEKCDIYMCCCLDPDPDCSCPAEGCCECDPNACKDYYPCISYFLDVTSQGFDLPRLGNEFNVSAIYYTGKVYEFYKENFGLDGYKGDGSETRVVTNYLYTTTGDPSISAYDSFADSIILGRGCMGDQNCEQTLGYDNLAGALDTIAHEYTHAVHTYSEVGILLMNGENGALAESFADIMACAVEYWVAHTEDTFAGSFDYEFEEDVRFDEYGNPMPTRSLQDPHSSNPPQPDIYLGDYWDASSIHNMGGVPNKMFYLLSEGGEHNGISVTGLGADSEHVLNAAKVIYYAATEKWEKSEAFGFAAARDECIHAAKELDNENGTHWSYSVANAWAAVEVGDEVVGDVFEPDNWKESASIINLDEQQAHSISPTNDSDWLTFTLSETTPVCIETSGSSGDTRIWLRDDQGIVIESDDDGGGEYFSKIEIELDAGTYYIEIVEDGNDAEINSYDIEVKCVPDLIISYVSAWDYYYGYPFCRVGWPTMIKVTTKNVGSASAVSSHTGLYIDNAYLGYWNIGSLGVNNGSSTYCVYYFGWRGYHTIKAKADQHGYVSENDESNNYRSISFYIY